MTAEHVIAAESTIPNAPQERVPGEHLTRECIRHIAEYGLDSAAQEMLPKVVVQANYLDLLLDPEFLPPEAASRAAAIMRDADPQFCAHVQRQNIGSDIKQDLGRIGRALNIFETLGTCDALLPWLRTLTIHPNEHIRSKAVKILCQMRPSVGLVERQLKSEDARVRANAIEALWSVNSAEAIVIFREALSDSSHRVVVNALVGLYRRNVKGAFEKLLTLSDDPSALVRSAAAWGMGEIRDKRGIMALKKLAQDRARVVRLRAELSLNLFQGEVAVARNSTP